MRVGSDTGGTFTDIVVESGEVVKLLSTPEDPSIAIEQGMSKAVQALGESGEGFSGWSLLSHGTTVATNAVLERKGAQVALVTNNGFLDIIEIGRQNRPSLYDPFADRPEPLVPRHLRYGVKGRMDFNGSELEPLDLSSLGEIDKDAEAAAVCLLHSDINPSHEKEVAARLTSQGMDVSCSCDVAPEFREYERTSTVVMNAYLRPIMRGYLDRLNLLAESVLVMTSAGGLVPLDSAKEKPVQLLLSGPAGGVVAGGFYAGANGFLDAVTFDMGGTSTDICLISNGQPTPAAERDMAGLPVRVPALDVLTIGAGGGSIASLDSGGALRVGPESAGASPGPACYGLGGTTPTVTDANLLTGKISADASFSDLGQLDLEAARAAFLDKEFEPEDVLSVVEANMARALRRATVDQGIDIRQLVIVAFGGAGPLHACGLAEKLDMSTVVIPPRAGVLSAVGILGSSPQVNLVKSWHMPQDHSGLDSALSQLAEQASQKLLGKPVSVEVGLDCRYTGQSHEITVPNIESFHTAHKIKNGYENKDFPIEVVALRAAARSEPALNLSELSRPDGYFEDLSNSRHKKLSGPVVMTEPDTTVWIPEGWHAKEGAAGSIVIQRRAAKW